MFWDSWLWLDVHERPAPGGWVNSLVMEEYQVVHPTLESLWRADAFKPLVEWVNDDLAQATHVAMWGSADDATWAHLVRDGRMLKGGWPIGAGNRASAHLLPLHGHLA